MNPLAVEDIKRIGTEIADHYVANKGSLTESAMEVLGRNTYTPEQIKRICEEANTVQYLREFDKAEPPKKNVHFEHGPIEPAIVLAKLLDDTDALPLAERNMLKEGAKNISAACANEQGLDKGYMELQKVAAELSTMLWEAQSVYDDLADKLSGQVKIASSEIGSGIVCAALEKLAGEPWVYNLALYEIQQRQTFNPEKMKVASTFRLNPEHPLVSTMKKFGAVAKEYAIREIAYKETGQKLEEAFKATAMAAMARN